MLLKTVLNRQHIGAKAFLKSQSMSSNHTRHLITYCEVSNKSGVLITCRQENFPKSNKRGGSNSAYSWGFFYIYYIKNSICCRFLKKLINKETLTRNLVGKMFSKRVRKTPCLLETSLVVARVLQHPQFLRFQVIQHLQSFDILLLSGECQHPQLKNSIKTQHPQY